jgi:arylsulfatase A-like enzyme
MELDYRTGEVLDAIKAAGIEDNTIVIWASDDGASPLAGPPASRGGSNGTWAGELSLGRKKGVFGWKPVGFHPETPAENSALTFVKNAPINELSTSK